MSLKAAIKVKTSTTNSSSRNPQYYNKEKAKFIDELCNHPDENVRIAALSSEHCPAKVLQKTLEVETDTDVIRTILMNENLPKKAIVDFSKSDRAEEFDDDEELFEFIKSRNIEQ